MVNFKTSGGGHYGKGMFDPGATWGSYKESVIAQLINKSILKLTGVSDTSDFRATNVNNNLYNQVVSMDNVAGYSDWNLTHHLNAFNRSANGVEVWYYLGDEAARKKAVEVSAAIAKALGLVNRGAKPTTNLYVISQSKGHTLLIEWCFIDNKKDIESLMANMDKAVKAMLNCFDNKQTGGGTTVAKANKDYYGTGNYFVALQDLKTMNKEWTKQDYSWLFKKGSRFAVRNKIIGKNGNVHAQVAGLDNTYVTLAKTHVKPQ
ncbi:MAG: N-acetylmuramoyl-L-alanine amidase [Vagococcus salmoninarum]|uniref:N-acetylmuramoyl-L-alanine amidase n=1 Tax=Vagococcus salmoninarum TaxID=2739 RepID=UPI003F96B09C